MKLTDLQAILTDNTKSHAIKVRDALAWVADALAEAPVVQKTRNSVQRKSAKPAKDAK